MGVCVSASVGNAFIPHCVMRHESPSPSVNRLNFHSGPKQCERPSFPSTTCSGPVYPFSAMSAASTPLCVAIGSTVFFIMVSLPAVTAPRDFIDHFERDLDVVLLISAKRAADGIEEETFRLVHGILREMVELEGSRPARHFRGDCFLCGNCFFRCGHDLSWVRANG